MYINSQLSTCVGTQSPKYIEMAQGHISLSKTRLAHRFFGSTRTLPTKQVQEKTGREIKEVSIYGLKEESRKREPNYPTIWHSSSELMSLRTKGHNTSTLITKKQISHHTKTNSTSIQQQTSRCYTFLLIKWWSFLQRE
jgi:hypothetical protein